jgi:peptidoglycan/LPS O-acetylase OafA/YrhL
MSLTKTMMSGPTLGDRFDMAGGRPSGFDYMRLCLAVSVVLVHIPTINLGDLWTREMVWHGPFRPILGLILPMFFALSGFLVAGSLERSKTVADFLTLRVMRIFPALVVEVFISALILGVITTTLSLNEYFSSTVFWKYFLNMVCYIHYELPGVFI